MQNTPQANFVNPAVTNECNLLLGLPVISSVHLNLGHSGFSFNQVLKKQGDGTYLFDGNSVMSKLGNRNYFDTEIHTNLLFVGFWIKENYITFTVNEKADLFITYPGDLFSVGWKGNTQFEGETAKFSGTAGLFNYRREYAVGIARKNESDVWLGARAKLLFGKLNTTFTKSKIDLYTDPTTFDLTFNSDWQMNTSMPITVNETDSGTVESVDFEGNAVDILLNRKNIGFATDLGFIKELNEDVTLSGSILDLGFISWRDNGYAFQQKGNYTYDGPLGDTIDDENYFDDLTRVVQEEFGITAQPKTYTQFLSPRIYFGGTYRLKDDLNAGLLLTSKITRFRITSGLTLSLNKAFTDWFSGSLSLSYMYRDIKNVGAGFKLGRKPLQFYMVTDNIIAAFSPYSVRNVNLRFGLQLNFGCDKNSGKGSSKGCGCAGMDDSSKHQERIKKLVRKK